MVLSGPSGVGKDTVLDLWLTREPRLKRVVTHTTRKPRPGEIPWVHYVFESEAEFMARATRGEFWEHKRVHNHWYGSPRTMSETWMREGFWPVLKIDVQGAQTVVELCPDAVTVFLAPPSLEELERRIRARGTETEEMVQLRLENARRELDAAEFYRFRIVNADLDETLRTLQEAVFG